jgi:CHU_C Type IX secretion signal domain
MKKYQTLLLLSLLCTASCKNDDDSNEPDDPTVEEPSYEPCCGADPVTFTIGEGKVFVGNAITPNFDGINDVFVPMFNSHISKIEDITITDTEGETLHTLDAYDLINPIAGTWQMKINDSTFYKGLFHYSMTIFDDAGQSSIIEGSACSILCDSAAVIFQTKQGCFFPIQTDGDGGVDPSFPNLEEDCFGG